jgi:hypothetical protein
VTPDIDLEGAPAGEDEGGEGARLERLLELSIQEAVYRAALADRGSLVHPALLDFLR